MKNIKILLFLFFVGGILVLPSKVDAASNLLSSLEVEGIGNLDISSTRTWNLTLSTSFDYANITATPADSTVNVSGGGKVSVNEGANQFIITASNGSQSETYTINLNVVKMAAGGDIKNITDSEGNLVTNPDSGSFASMSLIAGGIIVAIVLMRFASKTKKVHVF